MNKNLPETVRVFSLHRTTKGFNVRNFASHRMYDYYIPTFLLNPESKVTYTIRDVNNDADTEESEFAVFKRITIDESCLPELYSYRIDKTSFDRFQNLIKQFEGSHKFHNYTRQIGPNDPEAYRQINKAKAYELKMFNGIEFARISFKGQSFLYNQIRKMVAIVFMAMHYKLPDSVITDSLRSYTFKIPIAPAEGLMLNRVFLNSYNRKTSIQEPIEPWESKKDEIHNFRLKLVDHICSSEQQS